MIGPAALALAVAGIGLLAAGSACEAQTYPTRPIKIITPFPPGGGVEVTLRFLAQKLSDSGWQNVVVENRVGSGGAVAALAVKSALPDGYTLLQADIGTFAINPNLAPDLAYDPVKDFKPITPTWSFPSLLVLPGASPASSIAELVRLARTKPGGLTYASQGTGSGGHILGAMFAKATGAPMTHVPYRGAGPAIVDLVAGRADVMFTTLASVRGFLQDGQLKVIATTAGQRSPELRNVMTMREAGYPDVFLEAWFGIAAPAELPDGIATIIHEKVAAVMSTPEAVQKLKELGFDRMTGTPEEFRALIKREFERLAPIAKAVGAAAH
jgi:tripartite-type tricarboxylate transporter receptor subunit TctC